MDIIHDITRIFIKYLKYIKAWRALHSVMRIVKKGNKNMKSLAHTSLVHPILEYGVVCWDAYRECQISALERVHTHTHTQKTSTKFARHSGGAEWESLAQRRKTARMCALYKAYTSEKAWKEIEIFYMCQAT
jgi:hypothetical protein